MRRPEQKIHQTVVAHLRQRAIAGLVWWHTPQGAFYGGKHQGTIMKSLGVRAGVSDLLLFANGKLYCLEIKSEDGRASAAQMEFLSDIDRAGAFTAMPAGLDAALATLEAWGLLSGKTQ